MSHPCRLLLALLALAPLSALRSAVTAEALAPLPPVPRLDAASLPETDYLRAVGPHLHAGGERRRFWGVIGAFPHAPRFTPDEAPATRRAKTEAAYASNRALADRFETLGFNAWRMWHPREYTSFEKPYVRGDGSYQDVVDHLVAELKGRGFRIWVAGLDAVGRVRPEDVSILDEPATARAWSAAVEEWTNRSKNKTPPSLASRNLPRIWDPRLEALVIARMRLVADHYNQHTGLRWADDPVFGVWELTNEEWWVPRMVAGHWRALPAFFQESLIARWNDFLHEKYPTEEALLARWRFLLPDESYSGRTLQLVPYRQGENDVAFNDGSWLAVRSLRSGPRPAATREEVVRARGEDVLEFFNHLLLSHKRRLAAALKPSGRSLSLSPMLYDTGMGHDAASHWLHQNADAAAYCSYSVGWTTDRDHPRHPFFSALEELPRTGNEIPWFEHNRPENIPYLAYETQLQQPAKYRPEYPLRLLALASINDWDWINWHYWGPTPDLAAERPFDKPLDVTNSNHPQGYHFTFDEVQASAMRTAARAFVHRALLPAPDPTVFVFGRRSLYDPANMDYAGAFGGLARGADMNVSTYHYGSRLRVDPGVELDSIEGRFVRAQIHGTRLRFNPTPEIEFNPRRGFLSFDAPAFVSYVGFFADYGAGRLRFKQHDLVLEDVRIVNPPDNPYPVGDDERYLAFSAASADGLPLDRSARIDISLVSTSFNTGFKMGDKPALYNPGPGVARGTTPVLVTRVGATVRSPVLAGRPYVLRDWHNRVIARGQVPPDGALRIPADQPVWIVELSSR